MIKKFFIIVFVGILITACGKKGDPVFKQENQSTKILGAHLSTYA
jgi:hypothetical protein